MKEIIGINELKKMQINLLDAFHEYCVEQDLKFFISYCNPIEQHRVNTQICYRRMVYMQEIDIAEKKRLMLGMLEEIDLFCKQHDIQYFLTGGTLLGAIRHNGFIPWDDDIDIALKRNDYEKLLSEFHSSSGDVEILDFRNTKNYIWPSAKAINKKTLLIENGNKRAAIGVYLDVFPLDYIEGSYEEAKKYVKCVNKWKDMLTLKHLKVSKKRSVIKNAIVIAAKPLNIISDRIILNKIDSLSKKNDNSERCQYICNLAGAWGTKEIVRKEVFESSLTHIFEDKKYNIPIGYDELLRSLYGNYMELPPVEKRVTHHNNAAYWKSSKADIGKEIADSGEDM